MLHKNRRFQIFECRFPEELALKLHDHTWCACNGFRLGDTLWLNDSTGPDGAQEYAVFRLPAGTTEIVGDIIDAVQIESITTSWCTREKLTEYARNFVERSGTSYGRHTIRKHPEGTCPHCA